jgi:hypothetical protein
MKPVKVTLVVASALLLLACGDKAPQQRQGGDEPQKPESPKTPDPGSGCDTTPGKLADGRFRYVLTAEATSLYPQTPSAGSKQASVFPNYYAKQYPDLSATVAQFTTASLQRGGVGSQAEVCITDDRAVITLTGMGDLEGFAKKHEAFMAKGMGALTGSYSCFETEGCWNPKPGAQPWAYMLPLGLPIIEQQSVLLLDYPPSDALCGADYLNNFTMWRVQQVFESLGLTEAQTYLYETIIDTHPIAAPGSGQSSYIDATSSYFTTYIDDMTAVLAGNDKPFFVLGSPAQKAWSQIIKQPVTTGDAGTATVGGTSVPWIAGNHPDVTSYNCCFNDTNSYCTEDSGFGQSIDLVEDEIIDLYTYCATIAVAGGKSPEVAVAECKTKWCWNEKDENQPASDCSSESLHTICVRARQDYTWDVPDAQCKCPEAAEAFCKANTDNACPAVPAGSKNVSCTEYNKQCTNNEPHWSECPASG